MTPTSAPTVDYFDYSYSTDIYGEYTQELSQGLENIRFSYFMYKDRPISDGMCSEWIRFAEFGLKLPFDDVEVSAIHVSTANEDLKTGQVMRTSASCSHGVSVDYMVSKIKSGTQFMLDCEGSTFRQFSCGGHVVFCVDCPRDCNACPGKVSKRDA